MLELAAFTHEAWRAQRAILRGLSTTVFIAGASMALGLAIGCAFSVAAVYGPRMAKAAVGAYVFVLRGVPLLVTILFVFFGLGRVWGAMPAEAAAILAMGLFSGAYATEVFRGALQSVTSAQIDSARAIGLPWLGSLTYVILPLALRRAIPSLTNIAVDMIKASTLVAALGVSDLLQTGQQIAMRTLLIPEFYLALWAVYLAINFGITAFGGWCEERFRHVHD
jgi:His/Glu/Gln/Arg/opine family amino acid ABC transporter permease subunit